MSEKRKKVKLDVDQFILDYSRHSGIVGKMKAYEEMNISFQVFAGYAKQMPKVFSEIHLICLEMGKSVDNYLLIEEIEENG